MDDKYLGGCEAASKRFELGEVECCGSCHVDANEYGYDLSEIEIEGEGYFEVCCTVRLEYDKKYNPDTWNKPPKV